MAIKKKDEKVMAEEIIEVISILEKAFDKPFKIYSVDYDPVPHITGEIEGTPDKGVKFVCGYELTKAEYEKAKKYIRIDRKLEYTWASLDAKVSTDGNALYPEWYISGDTAVMVFPCIANLPPLEIIWALKELFFAITRNL